MAGLLRSLVKDSSSSVFPVFASAGSFHLFLDLVFDLYDDFVFRVGDDNTKKGALIIVFGTEKTPTDELASLLPRGDTSLSDLVTIRRVLLSQSVQVVSMPSILHFRAFIYAKQHLFKEYSAIFIWGIISAHETLSSEWSFQGLSKSLAVTCDFLNLNSPSEAPLVVFGDTDTSFQLQFGNLNISPIALSKDQQHPSSSLASFPTSSTSPRSGIDTGTAGQVPVMWALRHYIRVFLSRPSAQISWRVYELDR